MGKTQLAIANLRLHQLDAMVQVVFDGAGHRLEQADGARHGLLGRDAIRQIGAGDGGVGLSIDRSGLDRAAGEEDGHANARETTRLVKARLPLACHSP